MSARPDPQELRLEWLNGKAPRPGKYVLYWMQQSQRAHWNPALEYAAAHANDLHLPLLAVFGLHPAYPDANLRAYRFMLEGLLETRSALAERGVALVLESASPDDAALKWERDAALLVCDKDYLRHQRAWRAHVARDASCPVVQVEGDVIVPLEIVSDKQEYAARTLRPRLHKHLAQWLLPHQIIPLERDSSAWAQKGLKWKTADDALRALNPDPSVPPSPLYLGGTSHARAKLDHFIRSGLPRYDMEHSHPELDCVSGMSMYLHFGQISPVEIALRARDADGIPTPSRDAFLEELIVRRELAFNFVYYCRDYDAWSCLPDWTRKTLGKHRRDPRSPSYTLPQFKAAQTHDRYWNAAMLEMKHTGYMHNYMRMYWGKKILEWAPTPEEAFDWTLQLNNRYFLDGRDPCSFAGVAWIFGLHDRPWTERPIYGMIRSMSASGLERKFDPQGYVEKVEQRIRANYSQLS